MSIGDQIRDARADKHLSQEELAALIHVSRGKVSHWETGIREPKTTDIRELEKVLQFSSGLRFFLAILLNLHVGIFILHQLGGLHNLWDGLLQGFFVAFPVPRHGRARTKHRDKIGNAATGKTINNAEALPMPDASALFRLFSLKPDVSRDDFRLCLKSALTLRLRLILPRQGAVTSAVMKAVLSTGLVNSSLR